MTTNGFGSPGAGDATAKIEKRVIKGAEMRTARLRASDQIINRPIGSKVDLSDEDQITDWQAAVADPQALMEKVGQRALAVGPKKAALELLRWDAEMAKKVSE